MLKLKHGVTDALILMVCDRMKDHRLYAELVERLGEAGIRKQLEHMQWVIGFYQGDLCIAALWGDDKINLVTRQGYENKWINPAVYRQFWNWFFDRYENAWVIPDNGLVIPFLLRMGFKWKDKKLVMGLEDMKVAV